MKVQCITWNSITCLTWGINRKRNIGLLIHLTSWKDLINFRRSYWSSGYSLTHTHIKESSFLFLSMKTYSEWITPHKNSDVDNKCNWRDFRSLNLTYYIQCSWFWSFIPNSGHFCLTRAVGLHSNYKALDASLCLGTCKQKKHLPILCSTGPWFRLYPSGAARHRPLQQRKGALKAGNWGLVTISPIYKTLDTNSFSTLAVYGQPHWMAGNMHESRIIYCIGSEKKWIWTYIHSVHAMLHATLDPWTPRS